MSKAWAQLSRGRRDTLSCLGVSSVDGSQTRAKLRGTLHKHFPGAKAPGRCGQAANSHEEDGEVDGVKVGERRARACCQAPRKAHTPVPRVVDFACQPPPPADDELRPAFRVQRLQMPAPARWWGPRGGCGAEAGASVSMQRQKAKAQTQTMPRNAPTRKRHEAGH